MKIQSVLIVFVVFLLSCNRYFLFEGGLLQNFKVKVEQMLARVEYSTENKRFVMILTLLKTCFFISVILTVVTLIVTYTLLIMYCPLILLLHFAELELYRLDLAGHCANLVK